MPVRHPIDAALPAQCTKWPFCRLLEVNPSLPPISWTVKLKGRSMRLVPLLLTALILGASFVATSVPSVSAAEFGTRNDAVAMVQRVQEKFKKEGPDATFKAINNKVFLDRDLYPWVYRLSDGMNMADARFPAVRGKQLIDLRDQDGKFITREWIRIAETPPNRGWSNYRWPNPINNTVDDISSWIERMGDYLVGVGIHRYEQPNENTIGLVSGNPNSGDTYLQIAYELAEVLNSDDGLRILPIAGIGGPRNIRDVRNLRGVDIGLTQTSILNNFQRSNESVGQTDNKIVYIAKLFDEEVHLIAKPNITSIEQLRGLKVNLDAKGSGTSYSMRDLFKTFGIEIEEVSMSQLEALQKVRSGEIAATALIAGKPVSSLLKLSLSDGLHFVPIPYTRQLIGDYLPATLAQSDYPELMAPGETVDTVAVGAVLIAYNWPKTNVDRYRRVQRFVEAFFPRITDFQRPPHHPKWRDVNIAANLPGWTRFEVAQAWLDSRQQAAPRSPGTRAEPATTSPATRPATRTGAAKNADQPTGVDPGDLFQEFLKWRQRQ
jgi:TRAP-type uncharacterized transport system substrate-binding protein